MTGIDDAVVGRIPALDLDGPLPVRADVVVVGAGAAGCVLAARLSENPGLRVLLLEEGTTTGLEHAATVPGAALTLMNGPAADPMHSTAQQALGGRRVALLRGRGVGGGSSMNGMAWFRGYPADYDGWAARGAEGWGWDDVRSTLEAIDAPGGPMLITTPRDQSALPLAFLAAGHELGLPVSDDLNGRVREGVGLIRANIEDGRRHSVVNGYLAPASERVNLEVRSGVRVTGVVVEAGRATGVILRRGDAADEQVVDAGAVVLAAGALRTPQLLMLSGIGPAQHLGDHGISLQQDLPGVGKNLQDHPLVTPMWRITDGSPAFGATTRADEDVYELVHRGPLASYSQAGAMLRTDAGLPAPDIQVILTLVGADAAGRRIDEPVAVAATALLTPESRGTVTLASADALEAPVVDPAYLTQHEDRRRLTAGVHRVRELLETSALAGAVGDLMQPENWGEKDLDAWITATTASEWHLAGTCRLGRDEMAVVDPSSMSVHGVGGLYVADASTFPSVTRGNLQAPVILVAEQAAARIAADSAHR